MDDGVPPQVHLNQAQKSSPIVATCSLKLVGEFHAKSLVVAAEATRVRIPGIELSSSGDRREKDSPHISVVDLVRKVLCCFRVEVSAVFLKLGSDPNEIGMVELLRASQPSLPGSPSCAHSQTR